MNSMLLVSEARPTKDEELREVLAIFLNVPEKELELDTFASFQDFYEKTWASLGKGRPSEAEKMGAVSFKHACAVVKLISNNFSLTSTCLRPLLRGMLTSNPLFGSHSEDSINKTIDLALRLWIPLHIRDHNYAPGARTIQWDDHQSLGTFIQAQFAGPRTSNEVSERVDAMTMVKLRRFSGIGIEWTNDLSEHLNLSLNLGRRAVKVFPMKHYLNSVGKSGLEIIPNRVIQDYIVTMNLLFPSAEESTQRLLEDNGQQRLGMEGPVTDPRPLYLSDLTFWRDRLLILWVEFQSPPPSMTNLFYDRRNILQWYTFWFAVAILVLTIVFGVISSVLTGLQTGYSYQSLLLAREAAKAAQTCRPING